MRNLPCEFAAGARTIGIVAKRSSGRGARDDSYWAKAIAPPGLALTIQIVA
jgi:hypothetical protein